MAGNTIASLLVKVGADVSNLEKQLSSAMRKIDDTGKHMQQMGKTLSKNVTAPIAALGGVAVAAFGKQEKAEFKLRAALQGTEEQVNSLFNEYKQFASQLQQVSTIGDETTLKMIQQAESMGITGEAAKRAAKNAIALSASNDINAKSAIRYTAALEQGNATMLSRYLPTLRDIDDESQRVAKAQELLGNSWETAEAEANTFTGQLQQLKNSTGDLMEEFGAIIADAMRPLVDMLQLTVKWFRSLSDRTKTIITVVAGLAAAIGPLLFGMGSIVRLLPLLTSGFAVLTSPITGVVAAVAALAAGAVYVIDNWDAFKERFMRLWVVVKNAALEGVASIIEGLDSLISAIPGVGSVFSGMAGQIRSMKDEVGEAETEFGTFGKAVSNTVDKVSNLLPKGTAKVDDMKSSFDGLTDSAKKAGEAVEQSFDTTIGQAQIKQANNLEKVTTKSLENMKATGAEAASVTEAAGVKALTFMERFQQGFARAGQQAKLTGQAVTQAFQAMADEGISSLNQLLAVTVNTARKIISAEIAKGIAAAVRGALTNVPFPFNIAAAASAGAAAAGLFNSIVPKLAEGGLAFGPTLAMVGDNPGAQSDPEVIAPLSKLQGLGGSQKVEVVGSIRGDQIHLANVRGKNRFR